MILKCGGLEWPGWECWVEQIQLWKEATADKSRDRVGKELVTTRDDRLRPGDARGWYPAVELAWIGWALAGGWQLDEWMMLTSC